MSSKSFEMVAIGGVGGSGTGVVAQLVKDVGFYLGSDLNSANDNLSFTLLFKRPRWFRRNVDRREVIFQGLDIFSRAMTGNTLSVADFGFISSAVADMAIRGQDHFKNGRGLWPFVRARKMIRPKKLDYSSMAVWCWKEPNTHIYLEYLRSYFKDLRYIHIMRNGLDMAYSGNQAQLFNWGPLFGVKIPDARELIPRAALSYWVKANQKAIAIGKELGEEKFLSINFDKLCATPKPEVDRLLSFLRTDNEKIDRLRLYNLFKTPESSGRYRQHDLTVLDQKDIEAVSDFGFSVGHQKSSKKTNQDTPLRITPENQESNLDTVPPMQ